MTVLTVGAKSDAQDDTEVKTTSRGRRPSADTSEVKTTASTTAAERRRSSAAVTITKPSGTTSTATKRTPRKV